MNTKKWQSYNSLRQPLWESSLRYGKTIFLLLHYKQIFPFDVSKKFIFFHQSHLLDDKSLMDDQFQRVVRQVRQNIAALLF